MTHQSVKEWLLENYPDYCGEVTVDLDRKQVEEKMAADHPDLNVHVPRYTYKRYGYGLSRLVANKFTQRIGALEHGFQGRLTNSGMSAISVVNEALRGQCRAGSIVVGRVMYGETPQVFETNDTTVRYVDLSDDSELQNQIENQNAKAIIVETVGNGGQMPVCDFNKLLSYCWMKDIVLVLDNTLLSASIYNPFDHLASVKTFFGEPTCQLVYLESLSKFYRADDYDEATGGIIVAPEEFIARCDNSLKWGHYMPFNSLREFPFDLYGAANELLMRVDQITKSVHKFLQTHSGVSSVVCNNHKHVPGGAIIFFEIDKTENLLDRLKAGLGPIKGSFGHPETTYLPFGAFMEDMPDGLVRLAIGYNETPEQIIEKLKVVLEVN
jgi:cystathionine beta-lyase/cystathionine gamma-synthase